ncbi:MAG: protein phosphatase 2C domain-containing protein, partial [Elusimicrobiota bacterium]
MSAFVPRPETALPAEPAIHRRGGSGSSAERPGQPLSKSRMGTTLALVFFASDFVVVAHVGDSRVYRVRDGKAEAVTEDHSFVNAQL